MTPFDKVPHLAVVHGKIGDGDDMPTRLHRANIITDVFGGAKSVNAALARFKQEGRGVLVILRDGTAGVPVQKLPQDGESEAEAARTHQWREVGLGAQILKDLGVRSIRLLSSSQHVCRPRRLRDRDPGPRGWKRSRRKTASGAFTPKPKFMPSRQSSVRTERNRRGDRSSACRGPQPRGRPAPTTPWITPPMMAAGSTPPPIGTQAWRLLLKR